MPALMALAGPDRGRRFEIAAESTTLGRDPACRLRLRDDEVSRTHAEIRADGDGWLLLDRQSSNGTQVNGVAIQSHRLRHGDRVRLGGTELLFADTRRPPAELARRVALVTDDAPVDSSALLRALSAEPTLLGAAGADATRSVWLRDALAHLGTMYEVAHAASRIDDLQQLFETLLELVVRELRPDRACALVKDAETGLLQPLAAQGPDLAGGTMAVSRSIVDYAMAKGEGVLVLDARSDERFQESASLARLGIREVLCAPLRGRHDTLGVLYVDTRADRADALAGGTARKFNEDHLRLLIAVAHQGGLAAEDHRLHAAVVQAERLAAIGQTFATISHHVKNILQGVIAGNEVVDMGFRDRNWDLAGQGWGIVKRNQDRIYGLVTDMLNLSKDRTLEFQPVDLNAVVRDVAELTAGRADDRGIAFALRLAADLPPVAGDAESLHRALLNLVANALDACADEDAPAVTVETRSHHETGRVEVAVVDNGPGVAPADLERIFQVFVSTKGARGTGLGLPVTRKTLREHAGDVDYVRLQPGSRFTMWLPAK